MPAAVLLVLLVLHVLPVAAAPAFAQATSPTVDDATRGAIQRFRSAIDPAEARRALDDLRARAATSAHAALACGVLAAAPGSVVADRAVALECLRRGADAGLPQAQHRLALLLLDEPGRLRREEAEKLLGQSAGALPEGVYLLAKLRAERAADPAAARRATIEQAAKAGYAPAQRELAQQLHGEGDAGGASAWLDKAAAQGDAEAAYELAMLIVARERDADVPRIVALLEQASAGGSPRADYALGLRFASGDGVRRDTARSADLFRRAAAEGLPAAQYAFGIALMDGVGRAANEALALQWYEAAARQGHTDAMYALGNMHANGWGTGKSLDMAYRWYCQAAQRGHAAAVQLVRGSSLGRGCELPAAR